MIDSSKKLKEFAATLESSRKNSSATTILVSLGTCGRASGTAPILDAINTTIEAKGMRDSVNVVEVGCMGLCHSEPTVEVIHGVSGKSFIYGRVQVKDAEALVMEGANGISSMKILTRNWYYPEDEKPTKEALQARIVLRNCGRINPEIIEQYIANKGYQALAKVLTEMKPQEVIEVVKASGLRGRGGGGFPTGVKWAFAAAQPVEEKYVICNADEGDPGAFMDRAVLEGDPHSVLESMAIAGYAIGSNKGIIYIRAEYPQAIARLETAIAQAREQKLLGNNLFGSGFNFDIRLKLGAGAFVCGEETALIHSIEGKRGEPTFKPPFPAIQGLWKKPTIVNNVETFANVAAIIRQGADWFKKIGTTGSPGTKVFALAGKINKVGLVEVPMGTTLKNIIFGIGEGIMGGKAFKAVQTGGPSGGCIKSDQLETPIDYDTLKALGSMMGSGGMIVLDEDDCMVNVAKFFLEFTLDESCGKCTPCRVGNTRLFEMLELICQGKGTMETLQKLRELSAVIKDTALCGLGQTSPNPVISTMAQFMDEYVAHIVDHRCPAGACRHLITFTINDKCVGCTLCARQCPVGCISGEKKEKHAINQTKCTKCGVCFDVCKFHAIDKA